MAGAIGLITLLLAGVATTAPAAESAAPTGLRPHANPVLHSFLDSASVYPESIAVDPAGGVFYVGSVKEGTIYRGRPGSGELEVFSPGGADGRIIATGLSFAAGRLVVAGRQTGLIFVYDTANGRLIARLDTGRRAGETFLNDVAFAPDGSAYVTDSIDPVLYRVAPTPAGGYELQRFLRFEGTPLQYASAPGAPGINVNGIVATDDGRYLIIGKRNENALFRVEIATRTVTRIEVSGGALQTPDGLHLRGTTLFVAQNLPKAVAVLRLLEDFSSGRVLRSIPHPTFAFPTSVARLGNRLLVVSAQFDTAGSPAAVSGTQPPVLPFWVSEIDAGDE